MGKRQKARSTRVVLTSIALSLAHHRLTPLACDLSPIAYDLSPVIQRST